MRLSFFLRRVQVLTENCASYQEILLMLDTVIARVSSIRSKTSITTLPKGIQINGIIPDSCGYVIDRFTANLSNSIFEVSFDNDCDKAVITLDVSILQGLHPENFDFMKVINECFDDFLLDIVNFLLDIVDGLVLKVE